MQLRSCVIWICLLALMSSACKSTQPSSSASNGTLDPERQGFILDSLFYEAQRFKMLGDYKKATQFFLDYLVYDRRNAAVHYELSRLFMEAQDGPMALSFARRAYRLDSANKWYAHSLAEAFMVNHRYDSAVVFYDKLLKWQPRDIDITFNKAMALSRGHQFASAIELFDSLENQVGVFEEINYQKYRIFLRMNMFAQAAAEVQKLVRQKPEEIRYYGMLAEVYEAAQDSVHTRQYYEKMLSLDSTHPRALIALANMERKQGNLNQYQNYLTQAFQSPHYNLDEKIAYVYPYLKLVEVDTSLLYDGLQLSQWIIDSHPQEPKAMALRADMFAQGRLMDSALYYYKKAVKSQQAPFSVWYQLLWIQSQQQHVDSLLKYGTIAVKQFPEEFMAYFFQGLAYYFKRDASQSISTLRKGLQYAADKRFEADAYAILGDSYHQLGDYTLRDQSYKAVLNIRPDDHVVLNNWSFYLAIQGTQLHLAASMSKRSIELQPDSPTYIDTYAYILFKQGKYKDAKHWMEQALNHDTAQNNPTILEHYGDILYYLKDRVGAMHYWELAKQKGSASVVLQRKIADKKYYKP
jgi:tetratricopeptide (TPR) repeat protein